MKNKFMAAAAIVAILTATGAASADEISNLKTQSIALKKQNAALEKRLNKLEKKQAADERKQKTLQASRGEKAAPDSFMGMVTKGPLEVISDEGPVCFHGICIFGTLDAGLGYATHGATNSGGFYAGDTLLQKYYNRANFGIMPSGLSQTSIGIKGSEEILPGLSGIFYANTGFNPQSGQLANAPGSQVANNGVDIRNQSMNADGTRGGQAFNDQLYAGLASKTFGQLTFGRQKSLSNDLISVYDPAGGAYDYSVIGYSGTPVAGLGETDLGRLDDTIKYRLEYGPAHFGALYKFKDGSAGVAAAAPTATAPQCGPIGTSCASHNDGYQFDLGGELYGFSLDGVYSHFNQAITYSTLGTAPLAANGVNPAENTLGNQGLGGTVADLDSFMVAGKYSWNQFKFYAGYANDQYKNPSDRAGIGANSGQGDYSIVSVNNGAFPHTKILQTEWVGAKYAWDPKTEFTIAYYHEGQNGYGTTANLATCGLARLNATNPNSSAPRSGTCSGGLNAVSAYVDYHFTKRFDMYGGFMVSGVTGGMASGYLYTANFAPTVGARFSF